MLMVFCCHRCRNTAVDLTHIDTPANMSYWPLFHNGVAAGLKISNMSQVVSTLSVEFLLTDIIQCWPGIRSPHFCETPTLNLALKNPQTPTLG